MQKTNFKYQLIIADDYSTDGTREIVEAYAAKYPEIIQLLLQPQNKGANENFLDLLSIAKTKYVIYTEGDDYFIDNYKLQKQVDFLEKNIHYSSCFHFVNVIWDDQLKNNYIFPAKIEKDFLTLQDVLDGNIMQTNSVMYRWRFVKEDIREFMPNDILPADWFLHMLHAEKAEVGFIPEIMSIYRRHKAGMWIDVNSYQHFYNHGQKMLNFYKTAYFHFKDKGAVDHFRLDYISLKHKLQELDISIEDGLGSGYCL